MLVQAIIVITLLFGLVGKNEIQGTNEIVITGINPDTCEERAKRAEAEYKKVRGVIKVEAHCEYYIDL